MKVVIHDLEVVPYLDRHPEGQSSLHISIGFSIEEFIETSDSLSQDEKNELIELWFNENVPRTYRKCDYGVEISRKP